MKTYLLLFLLLFVSMTCFGLNGQVIDSILIRGTVTDPSSLPLLGATVQVMNTQKFVTTDFDGNYAIYAKPENTLVFSYPGYDQQLIVVGNQTQINVEMKTVISCYLAPQVANKIILKRSLNYEINELTFKNQWGILPYDFTFGASLGSNFNENSTYSYFLQNSFRISPFRYIQMKGSVENQNFNEQQFHQYLLTVSTSFDLLKFNSKNYRYPRLGLIFGHLNYDGFEQNKTLGIGLGLSRDLFTHFTLSASYTYWNNLSEVKTEAFYHLGNSNWSALANYRHLSDYEEFQIGVAYNLNFY